MRKLKTALLVAASLAAPVWSQTPACDALAGPKRELAQRLLQSEHPYDCCDDTLDRCLAARPTCALAVRLAESICRRVAAGQDEARIGRSLSRRARSMVGGGEPAIIAVDPAASIGPESASVTLAVYACARCPYCSKLVPALLREVREGRLHGQVRLVLRAFPIRGHEGSTEGGLAFVAAAEMGRFWDFLLYSYEHFDAFAPERQREWAVAVGLDGDAFAARAADPAVREKLVASKKEGIINGVEETPTVFINGRNWAGDLELAELVDAVEEEAQRLGGRQWHQP
jgi:glutaredoxin